MRRNVIVQINGDNVSDDGEHQNVSLVTRGVYDHSDGVHTLRYVESDEESGEEIQTTILVDGDRVFVTDDASLTQIMFQRGLRFSSVMRDEADVPVEVGVFPTRVDVEMNEDSGTLDLSYQMDLDGTVVGDSSIRLSYYHADI